MLEVSRLLGTVEQAHCFAPTAAQTWVRHVSIPFSTHQLVPSLEDSLPGRGTSVGKRVGLPADIIDVRDRHAAYAGAGLHRTV